MKKWLGTLTTLAITAAPIAAVVSCGDTPKEQVDPNLQTFNVINDSKDVSDAVASVISNHFNEYIDEGVEAQALKDIHLFDSSTSPWGDDEGDYLLDTNELIINTYKLHTYTNFTEDDKANYIMQLLAHEYNHYVDHSYLLNIDASSPEADDSIHDWESNGGKVSPWPKAFLSEFKKDLKYDTDTPSYQDVEVAPGKKSIGSKYNQKDLFDYANGDKDPSVNPLDTSNLVFAPVDPKIDTSLVLRSDAIPYLYCMDELFARKMQIATSSYFRSTHFGADGYMTIPHKTSLAPYAQDVVNYQRGLNDFDNNGLYLQDKPTESLATLYDNIRGKEENTITFAEVKSDKQIQSDNTIKGDEDRSMIRFGGISSPDSFVGYMENGNFINIPVTHKSGTFLTGYIKAAYVLKQQLYIADDATGSNKKAITGTRDVKYGLVTTHRYLDKDDAVNYSFDVNGILQTLHKHKTIINIERKKGGRYERSK